jgi:hypothetical protein
MKTGGVPGKKRDHQKKNLGGRSQDTLAAGRARLLLNLKPLLARRRCFRAAKAVG